MAEKEKKDEQQTEKPLDKMTVPELRAKAKEIPDVTGVSGMKKDQLLAIIKEAGANTTAKILPLQNLSWRSFDIPSHHSRRKNRWPQFYSTTQIANPVPF